MRSFRRFATHDAVLRLPRLFAAVPVRLTASLTPLAKIAVICASLATATALARAHSSSAPRTSHRTAPNLAFGVPLFPLAPALFPLFPLVPALTALAHSNLASTQ